MKTYYCTKLLTDKQTFATIKNKYITELPKSKTNYYQELRIEASLHPKKLWDALNTITFFISSVEELAACFDPSMKKWESSSVQSQSFSFYRNITRVFNKHHTLSE